MPYPYPDDEEMKILDLEYELKKAQEEKQALEKRLIEHEVNARQKEIGKSFVDRVREAENSRRPDQAANSVRQQAFEEHKTSFRERFASQQRLREKKAEELKMLGRQQSQEVWDKVNAIKEKRWEKPAGTDKS